MGKGHGDKNRELARRCGHTPGTGNLKRGKVMVTDESHSPEVWAHAYNGRLK
jgi:hypothetical protein